MLVFDLLYAFIIGMAIYIIIMQIAERRVEFGNYHQWNKLRLPIPSSECLLDAKIVNTAIKLDMIVLKLDEGLVILKEKPNLSKHGMVYAIERNHDVSEYCLYYHNTLWGRGSLGRAENLVNVLKTG